MINTATGHILTIAGKYQYYIKFITFTDELGYLKFDTKSLFICKLYQHSKGIKRYKYNRFALLIYCALVYKLA